MTINTDEFWKELESTGEDEVRKLRASDEVYGAGKRQRVDEWLRRKDQERNDSSQSEQIDIARSAKDAAWEAACEATKANRNAKIANIIASTAIAVAIASAVIAFKSSK